MISKEFFQALMELEKERKISQDMFISSMAAGISSAYKKETGLNRSIDIQLFPAKFTIRVFAYREVVDVVEDPEKQISLEDARKVKEIYNIGDHFIDEELSPKMFTRIAAQTAKQVIMQRLNDERKSQVLSEMNEKEGEIVTAIIRRVEKDNVYVEISGSQMEGIMMKNQDVYSVGVRKPDGEIEVHLSTYEGAGSKSLRKIPIVRGVISFIDSLVLGMKCLTFSASFYDEEEAQPSKADTVIQKLFGERAEKSLEFRDMLTRRTGLEVVMWDERLTTVAAEQTLIESGVRRENRKKYIDKIAAVFILQGYLDYIGMQKEEQPDADSL